MSLFLSYKRLKLKLRVFLAGHSVAMVTYCVMKIIPTCSPVIRQFFDTIIAPSLDEEWLWNLSLGRRALSRNTRHIQFI